MMESNEYESFEYRGFEYRIYARLTPTDERFDVYVKVGDEWIDVDDAPSFEDAKTIAENRIGTIIRREKMESIESDDDVIIDPNPNPVPRPEPAPSPPSPWPDSDDDEPSPGKPWGPIWC